MWSVWILLFMKLCAARWEDSYKIKFRGRVRMLIDLTFNILNAELNPISHLLALLGAHPILHVSRIRVNKRASYI